MTPVGLLVTLRLPTYGHVRLMSPLLFVEESSMTTYSQMIRWIVGHGHHDVARSMIVESMGMRSQLPHPDPIEASARTHERTAITIMLDCAADYIYEDARGGLPNEMCKCLFDAWMSIDCPGLVDQAVVNQLRLHGIYDEVTKGSLIPNSINKSTEQVADGKTPEAPQLPH